MTITGSEGVGWFAIISCSLLSAQHIPMHGKPDLQLPP